MGRSNLMTPSVLPILNRICIAEMTNFRYPMPTNYITLSRQALYDLVWTTPMPRLAQDFGITDVALAKRCHAVDNPVPPRGWWARKSAGQNPPRTPQPKYRSSEVAVTSPAKARRGPGAAKQVIRSGPEPQVHFGRPPPGTFAAPDLTPSATPEERAFLERLSSATVSAPLT